MARPRPSKTGQSIIEYLIIITVVVLVIVALKSRVRSAVDHLYNTATDKVDQAATNLQGM